RRRHTRCYRDWSSDVCSSDLGWMPKWPNPSYTNIMIGTHADSLVAEAFRKEFKGFDRQLAWQAVYKDAMTPPDGDTTRRWLDRRSEERRVGKESGAGGAGGT